MAIQEGTPETSQRSGDTAAYRDKCLWEVIVLQPQAEVLGQFPGLECGFADYEMIIINPLYFKPLYPNNYHLATAPRASSMRVMCTSSRKPALQRSTHGPRLQKRKPEAVLPAFPKLAGW